MSVLGTVVNGVIVPDKGVTLSEGARVRIEPEVTFEYPHPLAPYDREKELALLRESIAEMKAGVPGIPLKEAMAQIRAELNLPPVEAE
jgi:predicted DNA-binding antitoxin AbrB/MazE fold protein